MPSESVLIEKKKIVEELAAKLKYQSGVLVNYSGITVNEDTEMRVKMREANVDYSVVKNTLMRFAIKKAGLEELESILVGTTSLAVCDTDPVAPARIIKEYADKNQNYFEIKGGFMDGKILSVSEVNSIASIPPLPILQAQLLGTMLAPIASLALVLKLIAEKGGAPVDVEIAAPAAAAEVPAPVAAAEETTPAEAAAEEPAPVETVAEVSAPVETVAELPSPVETVAEAPAPVETVAEVPVPVETVAEVPAPVETVAEVPVPVETVAEVPAPVETVAEEPAPVEAAAEEPAEKAPAKPRAKKPAQEAAGEAPAEAPAKAPAKPRTKKTTAGETPAE